MKTENRAIKFAGMHQILMDELCAENNSVNQITPKM